MTELASTPSASDSSVGGSSKRSRRPSCQVSEHGAIRSEPAFWQIGVGTRSVDKTESTLAKSIGVMKSAAAVKDGPNILEESP